MGDGGGVLYEEGGVGMREVVWGVREGECWSGGGIRKSVEWCGG